MAVDRTLSKKLTEERISGDFNRRDMTEEQMKAVILTIVIIENCIDSGGNLYRLLKGLNI